MPCFGVVVTRKLAQGFVLIREIRDGIIVHGVVCRSSDAWPKNKKEINNFKHVKLSVAPSKTPEIPPVGEGGYVTPELYRGKRNEPHHVREVCKKIAELEEFDGGVVRVQVDNNAGKF